MAVLEAFSQAEQYLGLSEIVAITGLDKPAAQRYVHTLSKIGYLEKSSKSGRFRLGTKCLDLSFHFLRSHPLVTTATPILMQLRRDCGERTNLSLFDGTTLIYAIRMHGKEEYPQHSTLVGRRMPSFCAAGGRAMLSRLPDDQVDRILAQSDIRPLTPATIIDLDTIRDRIARARRDGYSFVNGESAIGELVVASAITDIGGAPIGAVHISGNRSKWQPEEFREQFSQHVMEAASYLSPQASSLPPVALNSHEPDDA